MAAKNGAVEKDYDDEFDDSDESDEISDDDDVVDTDIPQRPAYRGRDWRDIERYREDRALRALINDDLDLDSDD